MLKIGQTLWAINKKTGVEETVQITGLTDTHFVVWYKGKSGTYPLSDINTKFFTVPSHQSQHSCEYCALYVTEQCGGTVGSPCDDFKPRAFIPESASDDWPRYGDATAFRLANDRSK